MHRSKCRPVMSLWVKSRKSHREQMLAALPPKADIKRGVSLVRLVPKRTLGNDGLLRCCHLARVRKKNCVAARKFNDLRLGPLRHESLEVRIDHSVLFGNYCVARLLFPSRNRGLRVKCFS